MSLVVGVLCTCQGLQTQFTLCLHFPLHLCTLLTPCTLHPCKLFTVLPLRCVCAPGTGLAAVVLFSKHARLGMFPFVPSTLYAGWQSYWTSHHHTWLSPYTVEHGTPTLAHFSSRLAHFDSNMTSGVEPPAQDGKGVAPTAEAM